MSENTGNNSSQSNDVEKNEQEKTAIISSKRTRIGPAERMWAPMKIKFDEDYVYVSRNWGLRFLYYFAMFVGMPFVYLVFFFRWRFTIIGKENIRLIKNKPAVTIANHVHNLDAIMLTKAFYPNTPYLIALKHNLEAFVLGGFVRVMRGVPIPEDRANFERFSRQVGDVLQNTKKRIHMFPEGEIKPYSRELRKFRNGAFHFAVKNNVAILPMTYVFPAKKRIKLIIGKPININDYEEAKELSEPKKVVFLSKKSQEAMQNMLDEYYGARNINVKELAK